MNDFFTSGQLSTASGKSPHTIRKVANFLDIHPKCTDGGHRRFSRGEAVQIMKALEHPRDPVIELREAAGL